MDDTQSNNKCPKCVASGVVCGVHAPSWEELANYWKAEAERRQPQTDALKIAREALETAREELRLLMLKQPTTESRETYSDGLVSGLSYSIQRIDAALKESK